MVLNMADVTHSGVSDYTKMHVSSWCSKCPEDHVLRPPAPSRPAACISTDPLLTLTPDRVAAGSRTHAQLSKPGPALLSSQLSKCCRTPIDIDSAESQMFGPVPVRLTSSAQPDPMLAVTPDKSAHQVSGFKSSLRKEAHSAEGIDRLKQRVRFDIDRQEDSNNQVNDCDKVAPNGKYLEVVVHDNDAHVTETVFCGSAETERNATVNEPINNGTVNIPRKIFAKLDKGANLTLLDAGTSPSTGKVIVTREMQEQPTLTEYRYPFDVRSSVAEEEHVFSRPEFHNSLRVYSELKAMSAEEVDVPGVLAQHLALSTTARQDISEKAASRVNQKYNSSVYSGLVGLQAPVEDLCQHTERLISLRLKHRTPQKMVERASPDLMEFYSEEMERESADFHQLSLGGDGGMSLPPEQLCTAPDSLAFDLYRHNRVWDTLPK